LGKINLGPISHEFLSPCRRKTRMKRRKGKMKIKVLEINFLEETSTVQELLPKDSTVLSPSLPSHM
jgi:hypothetical protein